MAFDNDWLVHFFFGHAACRDLVALPGMELVPPAMETWRLSQGSPWWTCAFVGYGAYAKSGCSVDGTSHDNPRDMPESSDFLPGYHNLITT